MSVTSRVTTYLPTHTNMSTLVASHNIVTKDEWKAAREATLIKEKELTRARDALTKEIRALPWVKIEKAYKFDTPSGTKTLVELFKDKSQLFIYHFMLGPKETAGCSGCSFWVDSFKGMELFLPHRDVAFTAVSTAPLNVIEAYKKRMGWTFDWASAAPSEFNQDFDMSSSAGEDGGFRIFYKDANGDVYMTYYTTGRGGEVFNPVYAALDLVPKGRDENPVPHPMSWVRRHDEF